MALWSSRTVGTAISRSTVTANARGGGSGGGLLFHGFDISVDVDTIITADGGNGGGQGGTVGGGLITFLSNTAR